MAQETAAVSLWHHLTKKRHKLWIWKALDRNTGQLLDWEAVFQRWYPDLQMEDEPLAA